MPEPSKENGGMLQSALWYAEMGFRVHPLQVTGKFPNRELLGKGWKIDEVGSSDPDQIREWWGRVPLANIGIAQGVRTGTLVIDMDVKRGLRPGTELESYLKVNDLEMTFGPRCETPSGGWHLWVLLPPAATSIRRVHGFRPGIDVQADGSYVVVPPSLIREYARGSRRPGDPPPRRYERTEAICTQYRWTNMAGDLHVPTQREFFAALGRSVVPLEFLTDVVRTAVRKIDDGTDVTFADVNDRKHDVPLHRWRAEGVPIGEQQPSFWLAACSMAGRRMLRHDAYGILYEIAANSPVGDASYPWEPEDLHHIVDRAYDGKISLDSREAEQTELTYGSFLKGIGAR